MARVLVVEDVEAVRKAISAVLTTLGGHEVITAPNGRTGLDLLSFHDIDVVISDIWMPGKDGIAFLKEAKALHPTLPVIVITGGGPDFPPIELSVTVVESHGADAVLIKPFEDETLLAHVARLAAPHP